VNKSRNKAEEMRVGELVTSKKAKACEVIIQVKIGDECEYEVITIVNREA
jgi:hypothetical protein